MKQIYLLSAFLVFGSAIGQVVNPVAATTTFSAAFNTDLANVYNGVGLENFPSVTSNHAPTTPSNSGVANETTGNIDFDLGGTFNIDGIAFWNQNAGGPSTDIGVNEVTFLSSTDGITYTLIPGAPTSFLEVTIEPAPPETFSFPAVSTAFIRMSITSNHGGAFAGFAEIAFATGGILANKSFAVTNSIAIYPNPSANFVQVSGLKATESFTFYNVLGQSVMSGLVSDNVKIDVQNLANGIYYLNIGNGNSIRFIKE